MYHQYNERIYNYKQTIFMDMIHPNPLILTSPSFLKCYTSRVSLVNSSQLENAHPNPTIWRIPQM